ncbi:MAG: glycosyltransferase [Deltaproteobacteria bacterium]|nr:glycosyltransferase [Deltaproteobacteria bacterium]
MELGEEATRALEQICSADILVGIPSYNNARTIGHVVRAVCAGLAKYFPGERAVLVNSDGGSQDGTPEVVRQAGLHNYDPRTILVAHPTSPVHTIITPYHGVPGKGSAFRTIFRIAEVLGARACAVVDSDLRSITPEWVELLIRPISEYGFDFVAPLYRRHKYDGTITNSIVYPLTRALYGKKVRQPIGGDFGFSGRLAACYLTKDVWDSDVARYGIDIWMTTTAIANGFRACQAYLGAKIHDPRDPAADLTGMLVQVVGAVFDLMETYEHVWAQDGPSGEVPLFGFQYEVGLEPVHVNVERMMAAFRQGLADLVPVWEQVLAPQTLAGLLALKGAAGEEFNLPQDLWVRVIYDFAAAYRQRRVYHDHLLRALTPLYLGRTASFVLETWEADAAAVEENIEALCGRYEALRPYLLRAWRGDT